MAWGRALSRQRVDLAKQPQHLRVLYYNWVDYLDDEARGGGVSVYQRNLLGALAQHSDITPTFLSSGISYDLIRRRPRWHALRSDGRSPHVGRYEIINSQVMAPAHHSFGNMSQIDAPETLEVFYKFLRETGPYDIVHFNNIEGLPVQALDVQRIYPNAKVCLSLHNYYPLCPQVNFWQDEQNHCQSFEMGERCAGCLPIAPHEPTIRVANAIAYHLKCLGIRPGSRNFRYAFRVAGAITRRLSKMTHLFRRSGQKRNGPFATDFAKRRKSMVASINTHCDRVLCVSQAVWKIAEGHGISSDLLHLSYIGTDQAHHFETTEPRTSIVDEDGVLRLGYLGYMRRDKGFFFLLDALEAMPNAVLSKLHLVVAARRADANTMARLTDLSARLSLLTYYDGYSHDTLDEMLRDVSVGVVPVLWQDNLPQVAIEMHARHIPLLCSTFGGARELGNCDEMCFPAGDQSVFQDRITNLLSGKFDPDAYWGNARVPWSMDAHIRELKALYSSI